MGRKHFKPEQIIKKLREAEVLFSNEESVEQVCRKLGISDVTYYRWRKEYSGMKVEQAKRLKKLEQENSQPQEAGS